ncbi:hypothetical protein QOT17_25603 [Balamuthia mandrillaris]
MDERVTMQAGSYFDFLREAVDPVRLVEEIKEKLGDEKEKFEDSKAWFGERLGSNVVQMLEDGTLVELEHLRLMYFLMLHTGKQLEAFCGTRSLPHSGKKAVKAFRILQSFYCGWEEDIEPPFKDLADFPFDGPGTEEILIGTNEKPSYYKYGAWPPIYFASWVPVAVEDMKRWLAVLLGKNCLGKGVSRDEFWSSGSWFSVDFSRLNKIMGRDRWSAISSFFCIYNLDDDTPGTHTTPYWKVAELFSCFNQRCKANFSPSRFLSHDEQCVKNGHPTGLRHIKLPKKFVTVGVRIEAVSTTTGVLLGFMIDFPVGASSQNLQHLHLQNVLY